MRHAPRKGRPLAPHVRLPPLAAAGMHIVPSLVRLTMVVPSQGCHARWSAGMGPQRTLHDGIAVVLQATRIRERLDV